MFCAVTRGLCAWRLPTAYWRTRSRLLLWSAISLAGLTLNNPAFDKLLLPVVDLSDGPCTVRNADSSVWLSSHSNRVRWRTDPPFKNHFTIACSVPPPQDKQGDSREQIH